MNKLLRFFLTPRNLYLFGLVVTLVLTLLEVSRGRQANFIVFADSTLDFWNGISPYTHAWVEAHDRFFLYSPVFSVLFTPFALLPAWLGPFVWNIFNYTLFFVAIFTLPDRYPRNRKSQMFLLTLPILWQSLLAFQYNIVVAYIFLFAYSLLERDKGFWAILLIMLSGVTKVYGIFQLGLLLCYPHFRRNMGYAAVAGAALLLLPLFRLTPSELLPYYGEWIGSLSCHQSGGAYDSVFHIGPISRYLLPHFRLIQLGVLAILIGLLLANYKRFTSPQFRAQCLGILMGWVILFSDSAEKHTYIIALTGYVLWYSNHRPRVIDRWLLWANFILLCLVPIDICCPRQAMLFICRNLWINIWVFLFTWLRMIRLTFLRFEDQTPKPNDGV